jgi:hypothetical protein
MKYTAPYIQERIAQRLPEGKVVAMHDASGHWYGVRLVGAKEDPTEAFLEEKYVVEVDGIRYAKYPSVTGKLQILKDESLINYKKNQIIQFTYAHWKSFTDENIMEMMGKADRVPEDILADAGDIGTQIHDTRQDIFDHWIKTGDRPADFLSFIKPGEIDIRLKSAIRALQKFCEEKNYTPIACELFVYSHKMHVAGTLDDIGMMPDEQGKMLFVLMDLKSSNQFKNHYWFQVAMYWEMLSQIIGIRPQRSFILKISKENGCYTIEELRNILKLCTYAHAMIKTNEAVDYIKSYRKDNQKNVAEKIEF